MFSNTEGTTCSVARTSTARSLSTSFFQPSKRTMIYGLRTERCAQRSAFPAADQGRGSQDRPVYRQPKSSFRCLIWVKTTPESLSRWKYRSRVRSLRGSWNRCREMLHPCQGGASRCALGRSGLGPHSPCRWSDSISPLTYDVERATGCPCRFLSRPHDRRWARRGGLCVYS